MFSSKFTKLVANGASQLITIHATTRTTVRAIASSNPSGMSSMQMAGGGGPNAKLKPPSQQQQDNVHASIQTTINVNNNNVKIQVPTTNEKAQSQSLYADYETLQVTSPVSRVLHISLNRPERRNAINRALLHELSSVFRQIHEDRTCRAVVLSGGGPHFSSGVDHTDIRAIMHEITSVGTNSQGRTLARDVARRAKFLRNLLAKYQATFGQIEQCAKPVVAVVHGACLGAALNLICCADVRIATEDAFFQLNDVAAGMMADMGALQRMPKMVGSDSWMRELALSARAASAQEALQHGLISTIVPGNNVQDAIAHGLALAANIATKSPVAVQGTKLCLNYSRDHSVNDGLMWALNWNQSMLQSDDLLKAMEAIERKYEAPTEFEDM